MSAVRVHAIITGRVQGVCFRSWTEERMSALGLTGWVQNRPDRSVEVMLEGEKEKVDLAIKSLHRGPAMARVEDVLIDYEQPTGEFSRFSIR